MQPGDSKDTGSSRNGAVESLKLKIVDKNHEMKICEGFVPLYLGAESLKLFTPESMLWKYGFRHPEGLVLLASLAHLPKEVGTVLPDAIAMAYV